MSKLGRDIATYGIADLFARSLGLITSPFVTRLLTLEQYGASPLLSGVWAPVALLQYGGMDSAYPYFKAKDTDGTQNPNLITTATYISNFFCIVIWMLFAIVGLSSSWLQDYAAITRTELALFMLTLLPAGLIYWLLYLLRFMHKAEAFVRITLLGRILPFLATLPVLLAVAQPDRLMVMWALGAFIQILALAYALYEMHKADLWPYLRSNFSPQLIKPMLRYGLLLAPVAMVYALSTVMDRILVGWFMGPDDVAILQLAMSIGSISVMLAGWFGLAFDPHMVDWISTKDQALFLPKFQMIVNVLTGLFLGLACGAAIWSEWLFHYVYPDDYLLSANLVPLLVFASVFPVLSRVAVSTIIIADRPKLHVFVFLAGLIANVCVALYFIPRLGLIGAVSATIAGEATIFLLWGILGKFYFKNLNLAWSRTWLLCGIALAFVVLYDAGTIGTLSAFIQATTATVVLAMIFGIYMRIILGAEAFKRLLRSPLSFIAGEI